MASRLSTRGSVRLPPLPDIKHPLEVKMVGLPEITISSVKKSSSLAAEAPNINPTSRCYTARGAAADAVDRQVLSPYVGEKGYRGIDDRPYDGGQYIVRVREKCRPSSQISSPRPGEALFKHQVDQAEMLIKQKCRNNQTEVQKKFIDNDPRGSGEISRDGLLRVLVVLSAQPISRLMFNRLLVRFGLENKSVFTYKDLLHGSKTQAGTVDRYPKWMNNPGQINSGPTSTMTSDQVHQLLKIRSQTRKQDVFGMIPLASHGPHKIEKSEFHNAVTNLLQVNMSDEEFDKLWRRYAGNEEVVDGKTLVTKWGVLDEENDSDDTQELAAYHATTNMLRRKEADRHRSITVEKWIKNQFRQGYQNLRQGFTKVDSAGSGQLSAKEFCDVLANNGLPLRPEHLDEFLSRCGVVQSPKGVPYEEFLDKFQDRSNTGITQQILNNTAHRYNRKSPDNQSEAQLSSMSALEVQLLNMFQKEYLLLLNTFRKLDKYDMGVISTAEFRSAIECCFSLQLSDEQFASLLEHIPLTKYDEVRYIDFMAQFEAEEEARSLVSGLLPENLQFEDVEMTPRRSTTETYAIIQHLLTANFDKVEQEYASMEYYSSQTLTQEGLLKLLKRFPVSPPLTRGEVRELWQTLFTKSDNSLTWQQFISHFGFTGQTHTYVDSGKNPPKYGDSDYNVKSNRLNSDYNLLMGTTRQKIEYKWDDLRRSFQLLDPHKTGCLSQNDFRDVTNEFCVQLSVYDLNQIMQRYKATDGRVNYVTFLTDFSPNRQVWKAGNNMFNLLKHPQTPLNLSSIVEDPNSGLIGLSAKLRNKLSGNWKNLRRAFQRLDKSASGYLALPEFRNVLQLANIVLDADEVYHVMSALDEELTGRLDYNRFLNQLVRPLSQQSSTDVSRKCSRMSGLLPLSRQSVNRHASIAE